MVYCWRFRGSVDDEVDGGEVLFYLNKLHYVVLELVSYFLLMI